MGGRFHTADFPTKSPANPPVDQLLGVNDSDIAVGFYTDANGNNHGYAFNIRSNRYSAVTDPSLPGASLTAAAINNEGDIAGFYTTPPARPSGSSRRTTGSSSTWPFPGVVHHGAGRQRLR